MELPLRNMVSKPDDRGQAEDRNDLNVIGIQPVLAAGNCRDCRCKTHKLSRYKSRPY